MCNIVKINASDYDKSAAYFKYDIKNNYKKGNIINANIDGYKKLIGSYATNTEVVKCLKDNSSVSKFKGCISSINMKTRQRNALLSYASLFFL